MASGKYASRRWRGSPGGAVLQQAAPLDKARIRTRFPPEPNGYLHFGHAKAICLNFGLAIQYDGVCHLRLDDTNPEKEEEAYIKAILDAVRWLGYDWQTQRRDGAGVSGLYYASDYFDFMYQASEYLIAQGDAYVDSQSPEDIRQNRGTLTRAGLDSPWRGRHPDENLSLFRAMRNGEYADGEHVLRAKIDMSAPNINMRDPVLYRIRRATHYNTGDAWCIYPMYTYAHPIEDALENITHSLCTLEFEDQRPFYDWLLQRLAVGGLIQSPPPQQIEFSRLNLEYTVLSKRKLAQLVTEERVCGWDDPRMPTLAGARRRGYTPRGLRAFAERVGVSKSDAHIDYSVLEDCMRADLNETAPRRIAVLRPLRLIVSNYPDGQSEQCVAPNHPQKPEWGQREISFSKELWVERDDFMETPVKGFRRLSPGALVRLRYAYVVRCTGCEKDDDGEISALYCEYLPETRSGTPGADAVKVQGNIHWVGVPCAVAATARLYDRLFSEPLPGVRREGDPPEFERNFLDDFNPRSVETLQARVEPALGKAEPEARFQFERHGYFVADRCDSAPGQPVFNRTVSLRDSWGRSGK